MRLGVVGAAMTRRLPVAVLLAGMLPVGCRTVATPTQEGLEERVRAYWELRQGIGDWRTIYDRFLVPSERKDASLETYLDGRSTQLRIQGFEIVSVTVNGTEGVSSVKGVARMSIPGDSQPFRNVESVVEDRWVFVDGKWFVVWDRRGTQQ